MVMTYAMDVQAYLVLSKGRVAVPTGMGTALFGLTGAGFRGMGAELSGLGGDGLVGKGRGVAVGMGWWVVVMVVVVVYQS